ncbi:MAG TPA: MASE1 domain-containing protein [Gemmatimonadaceae bacterium]|nr:MASE1 domain-containing protein [Gemmatimonadaceae bacterium]
MHDMRHRLVWGAEVAVLAALYVTAARFGLALDAVAGFATLVWAPTGLAFAALLLRGYRLWPGVALGALLANLWAGAPVGAALGIALGNTLEAVVAVYALRQIPAFRASLERLVDVVAYIFLAAVMSTVVSATIGTATLRLSGIITVAETAAAWRTWWLGDMIGALVVAPVILVWGSTHRAMPERRRLLETLALAATVITASLLIFTFPIAPGTQALQAYLLFPPLIWAALRFGKRGAVTATFAASVIAVWGTINGGGAFAAATLYESLQELQIFMGVTATTFLLLGASMSERRRAHLELRVARETAEAANRAKAEFLAVVSHELRTPLNAISGYGEMLAMELSGPLTSEQGDAISRIQRNAQHLLTLIEEVLSFARNEAGRLRFTTTSVCVRTAIAELEPLVGAELQKKELRFLQKPPENDLRVRADPEKLRQILLNLVGNAIKFTPSGGQISVGATRERDTARIWVSDTGVGIPRDKLTRVFEPFYQVEGGATRRYPGFGLGLAIALDFARAMDGDMRIDSSPGGGTTVSVLLPLGERAGTVADAAYPTPVPDQADPVDPVDPPSARPAILS